MERPSYTVGCTSLSTSRFQRFRRVVFSSTNNKRQKQIYCQDFCFESNFLFTYHQSPTPHYLPLLSLSLSLSLSFSLSLFLSFSLSLFLSFSLSLSVCSPAPGLIGHAQSDAVCMGDSDAWS